MLDFNLITDPVTGEAVIETSLTGKLLLSLAALNKGTAFTDEERHTFGLIGKLPSQVETLDEQVNRAYLQFNSYNDDLQKHIYLYNLHDKNQVLFFKLVEQHLLELLPYIYTPTVGAAVKNYSRQFQQARGLYIAYPNRDRIDDILDNRSYPDIDLIVVTDGEGVLGIGDQGVGAMDIPIAKLMVYTLCAGINPLRTLPIMLDVGTNNQELLNDPLYLGLRQTRVRGQAYDDFIEQFVTAVQRKFPHVFLHWEDFGRETARPIMDRYRNRLCSFNDDIQGTAVVTLAALLAAVKANQSRISEQRVVVFGAGSAGTGITDQICAAMVREGLTEQEARERFWLVDRQGLITSDSKHIIDIQKPYARSVTELSTWQRENDGSIGLLEIIKQIQPTILIGTSSQTGAFNAEILKTMAQHVVHPIVLPLSNPTDRVEATPLEILTYTAGRALLATGSPFTPVSWQGREITIAQCNNALSFPGIGLGILATQATRLTDNMLWVACQTLSEMAPVLHNIQAPLLPSLAEAQEVAGKIAVKVGLQAAQDGVANSPLDELSLTQKISHMMWQPHYVPLRLKKG